MKTRNRKPTTDIAIDSVGARIRHLRQDAGMTQAEFAAKVFGPQGRQVRISRLERSSGTPNESTLKRIAQVCAVDESWLRTGVFIAASERTLVRVPGLARRIEAARRVRGLTRLELSQRSGLGASSCNIGRIENRNVTPRKDTVVRIAQALNFSVSELIGCAMR